MAHQEHSEIESDVHDAIDWTGDDLVPDADDRALVRTLRATPATLLRDTLGFSAGFSTAFAVSMLQGVAVVWMALWVPPPPRGARIAEMPDRFVAILVTPDEEVEPVEVEPSDEPEAEDALAMVVPTAAPEPEAAPEPPVEEPPPAEEPPPIEEPVPIEEAVEQAANDASASPAGMGMGAEGIGGTGDGAGPALGGGPPGPGRAQQATRDAAAVEERQERTDERRDDREARDRSEEDQRRVMRLEDTSEPPRPVEQEPRLGYPEELRAFTGNVVVECLITDSGRVRACRHRSGPEQLAEYVISVVTQWRFSPATDHDNNPVVTTYRFNIPFRQV